MIKIYFYGRTLTSAAGVDELWRELVHSDSR